MQFRVNITPVAKGRPRANIIYPKGGKKPFASLYTPRKTRDFERSVRDQVALEFLKTHRGPIEGPIMLAVQFFLERLKTIERQMPFKGHEDLDNLAKAVQDALNGLVWKDDAQITDMQARKRYVANGEWAHIIIDVEAMRSEQPQFLF